MHIFGVTDRGRGRLGMFTVQFYIPKQTGQIGYNGVNEG